MENISYKKQIQRLIEQIGKIQSIDTEKYKYFSSKATTALDRVKNEDYTALLDLEAELIDFLQDRVRTNQVENLPVLAAKPSLISRITKFFSRENQESEIAKIAEQLCREDSKAPKGQFVPDKRTAVYDFFKENISSFDMGRDLKENEKIIQFTNAEGHERTFEFYRDEYYGFDRIKIDGNRIDTYARYTGVDTPVKLESAMTEYLRLVKYSKFINSEEQHQAFVDMLGRETEKAAQGYSPDDTDASHRAGKKLHKTLKKNPLYMQMKTSFDRAYSEYQKTFVEFRQNEANRRDSFNEQNAFFQQVKVDGISEQIQAPEQEDVSNKPMTLEEFFDKNKSEEEFFTKGIPDHSGKKTLNTRQTVQFTDLEGHEKSFDLVTSDDSINSIEIGESGIGMYPPVFAHERNLFFEIRSLINYDNFINAETGDKSFVNEIGRIIDQVARGYTRDNEAEFFGADPRLEKALDLSPIYLRMKYNFDKAFEEYVKTQNAKVGGEPADN